ncbi:MAG: 6-phosphogluconolactonase [Nocardioidaceae bacterium]|nr:6-phosphogluconolactonase [Nocardioidaceae bacterium]
MSEEVVRLAEPDAVAQRMAADLVGLVEALQADGRVPRLVLTGGTVVRKVHAALAGPGVGGGAGAGAGGGAGGGAGPGVDWSRVELWWGDERFVPADDAERNAVQAWEDWLQHVPVDPDRVHAMPASDDEYADADAAAWVYARDLREAVGPDPDGTWFDLLMLGIGPDGHCASLFPGRAEVESEADVLGVHDSPKPPPTRISLGMGTLRRADRVWFVATGAEKADAVARSVRGTDVSSTPAAGPRGRTATAWYVDDEAAGRL